VYFGEGLSGYVVVSPSQEQEIDFQDADTTRRTSYEGEDGVELSGFVRRAAFALRFGDINPLISDFVKGDSRVLFMRDIRDRAKMLAPFLHFDHDPYPVIHDGRITWILDAYTTSDRYPYAQRVDTAGLSPGSGLDHRFNYARNPVKAVIDSYDGSVDFYVVDDEDPIIRAYRKAFPSLFTAGEDMPDELREHLRYPEDLFRVQTTAWGRYHLTDPSDFYNRDDRWQVAPDPGTAGAEAGTAATDEQGNTTETQSARIQPYYQLLQLPGEDEAEFVLLRPFIPFSENDERQQLTAFMVARSDPEHYGELVVYEMPAGQLPDGPGIVTAAIQSSQDVSQLETLLGSPDTGSKVLYGNLLLIPVDDVLLYVQPFYVEARDEQRQIPQLRKVIAAFGDEVVIEDTLGEALTALFDEELVTPDQTSPGDPNDPGDPGEEPDEPEGTPEEQALALLEEADELFVEAQEALDAGELGEYQQKNNEAEEKLREALALLRGLPPDDQPGSTTSTTEEASA
jgi:uncharacterized membrane protein (UPF0182 family)